MFSTLVTSCCFKSAMEIYLTSCDLVLARNNQDDILGCFQWLALHFVGLEIRIY